MVWDHGFHFRKTDGLDTDARDDLLVGEGEKKFSSNGGGCAFAETEENDGRGEEEGDAVCYYEGEEDLVEVSLRLEFAKGIVIFGRGKNA
jgi:hypothetical protein